jgi:hypothetical protein
VREVEGRSLSRRPPGFPRSGRVKFVSIVVVTGGWKKLRIVFCCNFGACGIEHSTADIVSGMYLVGHLVISDNNSEARRTLPSNWCDARYQE